MRKAEKIPHIHLSQVSQSGFNAKVNVLTFGKLQDFFFSSEKHLSAQHWFKYFIYINLFNPHNLSNLHAHKNRKLNHREIK